MISQKTLLPNWDQIGTIGKSRLVRRSWAWAVIVPIAANLLQKVPPTIRIPIGNETIDFPFSIPFSWVALFFAAVFFTAGGIIYTVFAPPIIQKFSDYSEFKRSGRAIRELGHFASGISIYENILQSKKLEIAWEVLLEFKPSTKNSGYLARAIQELLTHMDTDLEEGKWLIYMLVWDSSDDLGLIEPISEKISDQSVGEMFWTIRSLQEKTKQVPRNICLSCFAIGLALSAIVAVQSISWVIEYIFTH